MMWKHIKNRKMIQILALILVVTSLPIRTNAVETNMVVPRESKYLAMYRAYMYDTEKGTIQVWFDVTGTTQMEDLGVLSIEIYESTNNRDWTWQATYRHTSYRNMLGHNEYIHSGHITYSMITSGRYYKAQVCVWGGQNGKGDARHFWTNTIRIP